MPRSRLLCSRLPCIALIAVASVAAGSVSFAESAAADADQVTRTISTRTIEVPTPQLPRGIDAKSAIVFDANRGVRIWGRRTSQRRLIASTTKIMTALVAISRTRPSELLTATTYHPGAGESLLGLKPGERLTAQDLIRGLLLVSGNDAADTLAARTASSRGAFVAAMNRRARALGLTHTHFTNAVGLDSPGNYSTASDLARLARRALAVPRFANVVNKRRATLRSGSNVRKIKNSNPLIKAGHRWAIGVKTGHTMAAGYLLVGAAEKLDARLISVVTGEPSEAARLADSTTLLRYGRAHYRAVSPFRRSRALAALPVRFEDSSVKVYPAKDFALAARDGQRVVVRMTAPKEIEGPRSRGSRVGTAVVLRDGRQLAQLPVVLGSAIDAPPASAVMLHTLGRILPFVLLLLLVALIATFFLRTDRRRTRQPRFVG
jgi:D-alanyl-D-alanine carboxypeptidase (penicillin-binding protein 5/6)